MNKIILIIEDDLSMQKIYSMKFKHLPVTIIPATTLEEAAETFLNTPNVDLIILDGCIHSNDKLNTIPLLEKMRASYKGPIIAASGSPTYRMKMVTAGCNYESDKLSVDTLVERILKL